MLIYKFVQDVEVTELRNVQDVKMNGIVAGKKTVQYKICSIKTLIFFRNCQVKHWPQHKEHCDIMVGQN